jgi:hypothetical protein
MFSNKQIVCIEYMEITEDDEREIFRRLQLGSMALNYAQKMKAEAPTPRQTLVQEFSMPLRSLGFNDRGTPHSAGSHSRSRRSSTRVPLSNARP